MQKKSIDALFGFPLNTLPDSSFFEDPSEVNHQGALIENSSKIFKDKMYYLFDTIEVKRFRVDCSNVFFKSYKLHKVNLYALKRLMNNLFSIYGLDSQGKGKYCANDYSLFKDKEFYCLFGRHWENDNSECLCCDLSIDREANTLTLAFFGVGLLQNYTAKK